MSIPQGTQLDLWLDLPGGELDGGPQPPAEPLQLLFEILGGSLYAAAAPSTAPDALRLQIIDPDGEVMVPDLGKRRALSGSVEDGGSGGISFTIGVQDLDGVDPDLLDPRNLTRVSFGGRDIAEALMDSGPPVKQESGEWVYQIDGRGSLEILDNGVLYPEVWADNEDRAFDYGSKRTPYGGWYNPNQWHTPKWKFIHTSFRWTYKKRHWPKGWPDGRTYGKWLWSSSPEAGSADGPRWFRCEFTTLSTHRVRIWAAGDDTLQLKVDGNIVMSVGQDGWHKARSITMTLPAGDHVVAARVVNVATGNPLENRSGFACNIGVINSNGEVTSWIRRTATYTQWKVCSTEPPGWYPPLALRAHVIEGRDRNVEGYDNIILKFGDDYDSAKLPWTTRRDFSVPIGTTGPDLVDIIRNFGYDVQMLPGLRLSVWNNRGRDLRGLVAIGKPTAAGYSSRVWSRIKTVVLVHAAYGWSSWTTDKPGLRTAYGRREMTVSAGNAHSRPSAQRLGLAALRDVATPEETFDVTTTSTDGGPQPFRDYNCADLIMAAKDGKFIAVKVKSISFTENTDRSVTWVTSCYPYAVPVGV